MVDKQKINKYHLALDLLSQVSTSLYRRQSETKNKKITTRSFSKQRKIWLPAGQMFYYAFSTDKCL